MSKTIAISDDVYHRLEREIDDGNVSDLIEDLLDERRGLDDVAGQQVLDPDTGIGIDGSG